MVLLAIDRSTEVQSVALAADGKIAGRIFDGADSRSADWPVRASGFLADNGLEFHALDRIVVGMGPGSFAGIRAALAFAQGLAIGIKARRADLAAEPVVYGLPSAAALARDEGETAVVGDARRGLFWVVVYHGAKVAAEFRLVSREDLPAAVPETAAVVTPDGARIGEALAEMFGSRFAAASDGMPCSFPSAERLAQIALGFPDLLVPEPVPIYLSPAVRT